MTGERLPVGALVRVAGGNEYVSNHPPFAYDGAIGTVVGVESTTGRVQVRFPHPVSVGASEAHGRYVSDTDGTFHADWLHRVIYVRAEYLPATNTGPGARIRVRMRNAPRTQRTYPFPHEHSGMMGGNARAHCVGEFARNVAGMAEPDVTELYGRGRVSVFVVTDTHVGDCDCSDEYGPCEFHAETLVTREGASLRSADELAHEFLTDTASVLHHWPSPEFERDTLRLGNALADSGGSWFEDPDDADECRDLVTTAEGALGNAGYSVYWDDGYRIVRITGGPLTDA